jgi:hypothetical protein
VIFKSFLFTPKMNIDSRYINIIVALSNLSGFIDFHLNFYGFVLLFAMSASFIYHLSETKHGLPGITPLNQYADKLLMLDRFGVMIAIFTAAAFGQISRVVIESSLVGLAALAFSERDVIGDFIGYPMPVYNMEFLFFHCVWHIIAYRCYGVMIFGLK